MPAIDLTQHLDDAIARVRSHPPERARDKVLRLLEKAREQAAGAGHAPLLTRTAPRELHFVLSAIKSHPHTPASAAEALPPERPPGSTAPPLQPPQPPVAEGAPPRAFALPILTAGALVHVGDVDPSGEIYGFRKYELLDLGWVEAIVAYHRYKKNKHPFRSRPGQDPLASIIRLPNDATLALAGDWGTGIEPALGIGGRMAQRQPLVTIHLGDVYYAGSAHEERDKFILPWPKGSLGALALNSNHEMYSGGNGYYQALADPKFALQGGASYFALESDHWVIIGLDTAYHSTGDLYQTGNLDAEVQVPYLTALARHAREKGKRIILLTHHPGLSHVGDVGTGLWTQVLAAVPGGGPDYWYWGHAHLGAVYKQRENVRGRCLGHGGVPYAPPPELKRTPVWTEWFEAKLAGDPAAPQRALNGYALLTLQGRGLTERFYSEHDELRWHASDPAGGPVVA